MAVRAKSITVGQVPVAVLDAGHSIDGVRGTLTNTGSTAIFVGGDDMTSSNYATYSVEIDVGEGIDDVFLPTGEQMFAFLPSGSGVVSVLMTGV